MTDESFRKQLIENPKEVIEAEFGWKISKAVKINVLEEDTQTVYLVLPQVPLPDSETELT